MSDEDLLRLRYVLKSSGSSNRTSNRTRNIVEHGFDLKWAYHCVRLMNEVEQIMVEGDLDLQRNREQLKSIRRGEWTLEQFEDYFKNKEHVLETTYANSTLPHGPDEDKIKELLIACLEQHYGNLGAAVVRVPQMDKLLNDLDLLIAKYKHN